jgi:hypothetical protein
MRVVAQAKTAAGDFSFGKQSVRGLFSRVFRHGLLFVCAKSSVLIAPLVAAAVLSSSEYGAVEWWLSLSLTLGPLVSFGAYAIASQGTLGGPARRHVRTSVMVAITGGATLILVGVLLPVFGMSWRDSPIGPVSLQCAIVCFQMTLGARLKALGKGGWASLVESTLYASLLLALLFTLAGVDFLFGYCVVLFSAAVALAAGLVRSVSLPRLRRWYKRNYSASFLLGTKFMAGGLLMALFLALPRIWLGTVDSMEAVGRFALLLRWLSIAVVVQQFFNAVFFRQLFMEVSVDIRDRIHTVLLLVIGALTTLIVLIINGDVLPWIPRPTEPDDNIPWIMGIAMVLWPATASLEGWLYRIGKPMEQAKAVLVGLFTLGALVPLLMTSSLDAVPAVAIAWGCGFAAMISYQSYRLAQIGIRLPRMQITAAAFGVTFASICMLAE